MRLLEILIPSVPERAEKLKALKANLMNQILASELDISISTYVTESFVRGGLKIGNKRQHLVQNANAEYVVFIDDDDFVSDDYVSEIVKALESKPDVVTFNGNITTDGREHRRWEIKVGNDYIEANNIYYRPPNHMCPIKTEIAKFVGYNSDLSIEEDYDYCVRLKNSNLIKNSIHINKDLYHYDYKTTNKIYK
jgi:GT2 family glycosyltransferase